MAGDAIFTRILFIEHITSTLFFVAIKGSLYHCDGICLTRNIKVFVGLFLVERLVGVVEKTDLSLNTRISENRIHIVNAFYDKALTAQYNMPLQKVF